MGAGAYQRLLEWSQAAGHHLSAEETRTKTGEAWLVSVEMEGPIGVAFAAGDKTVDAAAQQVIEQLRTLGVAFMESGPGAGGGVDHLRVDYSGSWSGTFGGFSEAMRSVEGRGTQTFEVKDPTVQAVFTTSDQGAGRLTVQLLSGTTVVKEASSTDGLVML